MNTVKKEFIKVAIDRWDPIDLLPLAPADEYDGETQIIYDRIKDIDNLDESILPQVIYEVFIEMFGDTIFLRPLEECNIVAKEIMQLIE